MSNIEIKKTKHVSRHAARFIAVLSLYSFNINKQHSLNEIMKKILQAYFNKDIFDLEENEDIELQSPDELFLEQLLRLSEEKQETIESLIENNLIEKYSFDKLDAVIQAVLKLAATELLYCEEVPAKVIIDEYVNLTKTFYDNSEVGFVNKVVDVLAHSSRPDEVT